MSDRFPPLRPAPIQARVVARPPPAVPWFQITLTLALIALLHAI